MNIDDEFTCLTCIIRIGMICNIYIYIHIFLKVNVMKPTHVCKGRVLLGPLRPLKCCLLQALGSE